MYARFVKAGVLAGAIMLAGCGDSTGANGDLNQDEAEALGAAMLSLDAMGGAASGFGPTIFGQLSSTGTMTTTSAALATAGIVKDLNASIARRADEFTAVGMQVQLNIIMDGQEETGAAITSVFGWSGINTSSNTVDEMVYATAMIGGTSFPSSFTADLDQIEGWAGYAQNAGSSSATAFSATSGQFALSSASFGGSESCDIDDEQSGLSVDCEMSEGTLRGSFGFTGEGPSGGYTQPTTTFDLPAIRMVMTMDLDEYNAAKARVLRARN